MMFVKFNGNTTKTLHFGFSLTFLQFQSHKWCRQSTVYAVVLIT